MIDLSKVLLVVADGFLWIIAAGIILTAAGVFCLMVHFIKSGRNEKDAFEIRSDRDMALISAGISVFILLIAYGCVSAALALARSI